MEKKKTKMAGKRLFKVIHIFFMLLSDKQADSPPDGKW